LFFVDIRNNLILLTVLGYASVATAALRRGLAHLSRFHSAYYFLLEAAEPLREIKKFPASFLVLIFKL
tara:strand:+ start:286 stop:489 length:204 start_codon:yes stop_codon:yes gene_type:complete